MTTRGSRGTLPHAANAGKVEVTGRGSLALLMPLSHPTGPASESEPAQRQPSASQPSQPSPASPASVHRPRPASLIIIVLNHLFCNEQRLTTPSHLPTPFPRPSSSLQRTQNTSQRDCQPALCALSSVSSQGCRPHKVQPSTFFLPRSSLLHRSTGTLRRLSPYSSSGRAAPVSCLARC